MVTPLAPERFTLQFTISRDTHDKLRRVQDLLGRSVPSGDPSIIFDHALSGAQSTPHRGTCRLR